MSVRWLSYQSFQYSQQLIAALNTIIIDLKLRPDNESIATDAKVLEAVARVESFLDSFGTIVTNVQSSQNSSVLGTSSRMRQLATSYIKAKSNPKRFKSDLFKNSIEAFRTALAANQVENRERIILGLEEMRSLVEEHFTEDISDVVGEA